MGRKLQASWTISTIDDLKSIADFEDNLAVEMAAEIQKEIDLEVMHSMFKPIKDVVELLIAENLELWSNFPPVQLHHEDIKIPMDQLRDCPLNQYDDIALKIIESSPLGISVITDPTEKQLRAQKLIWKL